MHEIVKYFILTDIQEQCLNPMPEPLIGPGRPAARLRLMQAAGAGGAGWLRTTRLPSANRLGGGGCGGGGGGGGIAPRRQ